MFTPDVVADSCSRRFETRNFNHACYSADFFIYLFISRISLLCVVINVHGSKFLQNIVGFVSILDLTVYKLEPG